MAKFRPGTVFSTGRTSSGTYRTGVAISDQLIIEACENGSGHVGRWRTTVANRVERKATTKAELGDQLNHFNHWNGYQPGCYKSGFSVSKRGGVNGAGHYRRAIIFNDCPHALFVEMGRDPSGGREIFTTRRSVLGKLQGFQRGFLLNVRNGTNGFEGKHVLGQSWVEVLATTNTFNLRARNLSVGAGFYRAARANPDLLERAD